MFLEDSLNLGGVDAPNEYAAVGRTDRYILAVRTERGSSPITAYFESLVAVKKNVTR